MMRALCLVAAAALAAGASPVVGRVGVPDLGRSVTFRDDEMVAFVGSSVVVDGTKYAALEAINVTHPAAPVLLAPLSLGAVDAQVQGMVLAGNRSYIVCTNRANETTVHDVSSDPSVQEVAGVHAQVPGLTPADVVGLSYYEKHLFVLFSDLVHIYSTAITGRPTLVHTAYLAEISDATFATGIAVANNVAYITCATGTEGVVILDVSKADKPSFLEVLLTAGVPTAIAASDDGALLFVTSTTSNTSRPVVIEAFEITSSTESPLRVSEGAVPASVAVGGIVVADEYVLVATAAELILLNHTEGALLAGAFAEVGKVAVTAAPLGMVVTSEYTYVAASDNQFTVLNTSAITDIPVPAPTPSDDGGSGTSAGTKVGIAFGVIGGVALVGFVAFTLYRRQRVATYSAIN